MNIDSQTFLRLVENSKKLCFLDIESNGLKGDYHSVLCVSIRPWHGKPITFSVKQLGNDQKVVKDAKGELEKYLCWCTYYGKGFDLPMLNTRLTRWGSPPIDPRPHIDLFYTLKYKLLTSRKSQAHLLRFFNCKAQKMSLSSETWNGVYSPQAMRLLKQRCESDVEGLEALYDRTSHLIFDIKR